MNYMYAIMWVLVAAFLFYFAVKEHKILFVFSAYFAYLGIWWFLNELLAVDLFAGVYLIVFRVIAVVAVVFTVIIYIVQKKGVFKKG